jgi:hypothetical protein
MLKIIAWNLAHRAESWRLLLNTSADIALVQEAAAPLPDVAQRIVVDTAPWQTAGAGKYRPWRTAVVKLSDRVNVEWLETKAIVDAEPCELAASRLGTPAAAILSPSTGEPLIVASMYAHGKSSTRRREVEKFMRMRQFIALSLILRHSLVTTVGTASSPLAISISCTDMASTETVIGHLATTPYSIEWLR